MAAKAKKKARTLAVVEVDGQGDEPEEKDEDGTKGIPLFEGLGEEVKLEVYRLEPIEEGTIGRLEPDADEGTIARRWGGGVYRVTAKGTDGKFGRRQRTVMIGGDPKFESEDATRRYLIKMGKLPADPNAKPAAGPFPGFDLSSIMGLLQTSHQNAMAFMQAQVAAQQQQAQLSIAAASKLADEGRQRDREFFATMLQLQKADQKATDPLAMVPLMVKFLELGKNMASGEGRGGDAADPVTAFIQALPVILPQAQAMLTGGAANQQQPAPALPPAAPQPGQEPQIVLSGEIAVQLDATFRALRDKGYDAERAMTMAMQQLAQVPAAPKNDPAAAAAPPAGPERPAAPEASGDKKTSPPARATRGK